MYRGLFSLALPIFLILFSFFGCAASVGFSPKPQFRVRALWVDPPGFKDRTTVDHLIVKCRKAGINMILPDVMLRDEIWFKSDHFIGKVHADNQYDPLAYLIEKAHGAGIKVQPWSCTFYSKAKYPEWVSQSFIHRDYDKTFLSAANSDVHSYLLSVLGDLLKYDIDGIHLDYARYWNAAFDYSDVACDRFKRSYGFNPCDFFDHPEKIVPPSEEQYPIRALCSDTSIPYVANLGTMERNFNRMNSGYAFLSESPGNIDALRAPGLLILSFYYDVKPEMLAAIKRYVKRGGDLLWICPDKRLFENNPELVSLTGVNRLQQYANVPIELRVVDDRFGKSIDRSCIKINGNSMDVEQSDVIVSLSSGEPVVTLSQKEDEGKVVVVGFQLMNSNSPNLMEFFGRIVSQLRLEVGINAPDLMRKKREQWIDWRADCLKEFVRAVKRMVKNKKGDLPVTMAAGIGPQQYYGIYRDSRDLLSENIVDYIFPMNYANQMDDLADILDEQVLYTPAKMAKRIYPGIALYTRSGKARPVDAALVDQQLAMLKKYGYRGFCLFAYSYFSDEMVETVQKYDK